MLEILRNLTAKEISLFSAGFGGAMVLLNLIITLVVNYFFYLRKKIDERKYQSDYDFYQKLIIDNITTFIHFPAELHSEIDKTFSTFSNTPPEMKRVVVEESCDRLDVIYEEFKREVMPLIKCYSLYFYAAFDLLVEQIYEEAIVSTTELFSQANGHSPEYLKSKYAQAKETFLVSLFTLLKAYRPSPTGKKRYNTPNDCPTHLPIVNL